MKRIISLFLLLIFAFSIVSCAPDNVIAPETLPEVEDTPADTGSAPVNEQKPETDDKEQEDPVLPEVSTLAYVDTTKKEKNINVLPSLDVDTLTYSPLKIADLKAKEITFFTPERNAFNVGNMTEKQWFDQLSEQNEIKLNYTVRSDGTLYYAQSIALKSGMQLDIITNLISGIAPARSLMKSALTLTGDEIEIPFSKRVFDLSGGKVFTAKGVSKMLWYNKAIVKDENAYDVFTNGGWTTDALNASLADIGENKKIECGNWAAFGSASGTQATGLAPDGTFIMSVDTEATISAFKTFADIFTSVSDTENTFKNGKTAFTYTDTPNLDKGEIGFVPIPSVGETGVNVTELSGVGMGVCKNADETATQYALTFALLWSTRYTEARADALVFDYGLTPEAANKYIEFSEINGGLYNADRIVSSFFDKSTVNVSLCGSPEAALSSFQGAYDRAAVLNGRNQ